MYDTLQQSTMTIGVPFSVLDGAIVCDFPCSIDYGPSQYKMLRTYVISVVSEVSPVWSLLVIYIYIRYYILYYIMYAGRVKVGTPGHILSCTVPYVVRMTISYSMTVMSGTGTYLLLRTILVPLCSA